MSPSSSKFRSLPPQPFPVGGATSALETTVPGPPPRHPQLSDVEAPPVPQRAFPEGPPPADVVRRRMGFVYTCVALGVGAAVSSFQEGLPDLTIFALALVGFIVGRLLLMRNKPVTRCPFCEGVIERYDKLGTVPVRCPHCSEYSLFVSGSMRPVDPHGSFSIAQNPFYRSPVFENAVWPNGCVLCGAPPVRFDGASNQDFYFRRLVTPGTVLAPSPPSSRISGIPYCQHHRDAVQLVAPQAMSSFPWKYIMGDAEKKAEKHKAFLLWRSLPMMRRYLEANRGAHTTVSSA